MKPPMKKSMLKSQSKRAGKSMLKKVGLFDLLSPEEQDDILMHFEDPGGVEEFARDITGFDIRKAVKEAAIDAYRKKYGRGK